MVDRRIKAAKFPALKSKKLVLDLARSAFVDRRENIIALGPAAIDELRTGQVQD